MNHLQYHESRQRGSPDFPVEYHFLDERHPRYQMPYHWHEEYEILQVHSGSFDLTVDGEALTLHAGDAAFIDAEKLHGGIPQNCTYECVVFDMRLLLKSNDPCRRQIGEILHRQLAVQTFFSKDSIASTAVLPAMFSALRARHAGWELITLGCLLQFLGEVYRGGAYRPVGGDGRRALQLKKVFELIETEYASRLTLDDLAASVHMTPKYFCRFFKEATHRTPIDYLNYYRIEMACNELAAAEKTITEIAMDVGISNLNYFIRQFRRYKGVTPGRYLSMVIPSDLSKEEAP